MSMTMKRSMAGIRYHPGRLVGEGAVGSPPPPPSTPPATGRLAPLEPGGVFRGEAKDDPVAGLTEECFACHHGLKTPGFSFFTKIFGHVTVTGDDPDHTLGNVRVEVALT